MPIMTGCNGINTRFVAKHLRALLVSFRLRLLLRYLGSCFVFTQILLMWGWFGYPCHNQHPSHLLALKKYFRLRYVSKWEVQHLWSCTACFHLQLVINQIKPRQGQFDPPVGNITPQNCNLARRPSLGLVGISRLPCCVFRFVYLHSRRWEPSISWGTFETVLQRQK